MSEDWKDLAEEDDMDHAAQMAALKVVQGHEEATSYPPLKGRKMRKGIVQWKSTVTYPHRIRLGTLLDRQEPNSGLKEEKLVTRFFSRGAGKPAITVIAPLPGIDVEKLSEEEIEELVKNWEGGPKIDYIFDRETGKEEPHALLHSITPNLMIGKPVAVKEQKERDDSPSGQRTEVNICFKNIYLFLTLFMQAPGVKQVGKDPLPAIRKRLRRRAKREQEMQRREEVKTMVRLRDEKTARNRRFA